MFKKVDPKYLWFFLMVLVLWLLIPQFFIQYTPWFTGLYGVTSELESVFAPVNTLFSGLAFGILVITIYLQQQTIDSQKELSYKQSFESNFFRLLSLHRNNVDSIKCKTNKTYGEEREVSGRNSFRYFHRLLSTFYHIGVGNLDSNRGFIGDMDENDIKYFSETSKKISEDHVSENVRSMPYVALFRMYTREILCQCNRHIYQMLKYVDDSNLKDKEKMKYIRILRAQFNNYEVAILFYDTLFHREGKFKILIEKYSFFHNFSKQYLYNTEHQKKYAESAYGDKGYEFDVNPTELFSKFDISDN